MYSYYYERDGNYCKNVLELCLILKLFTPYSENIGLFIELNL